MPRFRYTDWSKGPVLYAVKQSFRGGIPWSSGPWIDKHAGEVIFECAAPDIMTADTALRDATGIDPVSALMVGCAIF